MCKFVTSHFWLDLNNTPYIPIYFMCRMSYKGVVYHSDDGNNMSVTHTFYYLDVDTPINKDVIAEAWKCFKEESPSAYKAMEEGRLPLFISMQAPRRHEVINGRVN